MYHRQRWTPEKIKQRLELIAPLVYISSWQEISAYEYWGSWKQGFVLRTKFVIPEFMNPTQPIALYLPLGDAGDFSYPEALAILAATMRL